MKLYSSLKPEFIKLDCRATSTEEILKELIHGLKLLNKISDEKQILEKLVEREKLGSTSIGNHSAVPHTKLKDLKEPIIFIGTSKKGIQYHENDKEPVHLVILILSPNCSPVIHLQILAAAASLVKKAGPMMDAVLAAQTPEELMRVVQKYESSDE